MTRKTYLEYMIENSIPFEWDVYINHDGKALYTFRVTDTECHFFYDARICEYCIGTGDCGVAAYKNWVYTQRLINGSDDIFLDDLHEYRIGDDKEIITYLQKSDIGGRLYNRLYDLVEVRSKSHEPASVSGLVTAGKNTVSMEGL